MLMSGPIGLVSKKPYQEHNAMSKNTEKRNTFVKEAHEKILESCLALKRLTEAIEAFNRAGNELFHKFGEAEHRQKFCDGLYQAQRAVYDVYARRIMDLMLFTEVQDEVRDLFKEQLDGMAEGKYCIMQFISRWGNMPSSWEAETEEQFRQDIKDWAQK
jgi:hypothetical protein